MSAFVGGMTEGSVVSDIFDCISKWFTSIESQQYRLSNNVLNVCALKITALVHKEKKVKH